MPQLSISIVWLLISLYGEHEAIIARIGVGEAAGYGASFALILGQLASALLICPGISSNSAAEPLS